MSIASRSSLIIGSLLLACTAHADVVAQSTAKVLPIPARDQAKESPPAGWCGETAIQEAMLYYGVRKSQRHINKAGRPGHPDLYWGDITRAFRNLGVRHRRWKGGADRVGFYRWVRAQIRAGKPVFAGVKLHPTEHPRWGLDHMVLIVGFDKDALLINTTWGRRERRTHAQLAGRKGISFANRSGHFFAYAIDGVKR